MVTINRRYGEPILIKTSDGVVEIRVHKNRALAGPSSGSPLVVHVHASKHIPVCRHGMNEEAE